MLKKNTPNCRSDATPPLPPVRLQAEVEAEGCTVGQQKIDGDKSKEGKQTIGAYGIPAVGMKGARD